MRKEVRSVWLRLLLFLLPFILLFAYLEYMASRLPNSYLKKKTGMEQAVDSARILILGSSQAFDDIDPVVLGHPAYNLANVSQSLYYDSRLALKYIDRMPGLRLVILTISDFTFGYEMGNLPEAWRQYFYWHYFGILHPSVEWLDSRYFFRFALYPPEMMKGMLFGKPVDSSWFDPVSREGWRPVPPPADSVSFNAKTAESLADFHASLRKSSLITTTAGYIEDLLKELDRRKMKAVAVVLPVTSVYSANVSPEILEENRKILEGLENKFGIKCFNYMKDPRFGQADFADADHLNSQGAAKFSLILKEEVIRPLY
jgi:hypothetical protein